jgi:hypothetical protein
MLWNTHVHNLQCHVPLQILPTPRHRYSIWPCLQQQHDAFHSSEPNFVFLFSSLHDLGSDFDRRNFRQPPQILWFSPLSFHMTRHVYYYNSMKRCHQSAVLNTTTTLCSLLLKRFVGFIYPGGVFSTMDARGERLL